jgi:ABC-2 type transport system permease protein
MSVGLVAKREIRERVRSRSFQVSTGIAILITVATIVLPSLETNPLRSKVRVGLVGRSESEVKRSLQQLGDDDTTVEYEAFDSRGQAARALRDDKIHVALIAKKEILLKEPVDPQDISPKVKIARVLSILPAITRAPIVVNSILEEPIRKKGNPGAAFFGTVLIYIFLFMYGSMILSGVAEEKGSRVIEVLLSTVPAKRLLYGKVIGIGTVAILQAALIGVVALVCMQIVGSDPLGSAVGGQIIQVFGWFALAYVFYAWAYAAAGATVSRQEEAQNLSFPVGLPILIAYGAAASAMGGEDSRLLRVLSFLPPTAPIAMPMRAALGFATTTHVAIAAAVTVVGALLMMRLAGTIYERSILRIGARVKLRDVLTRRAQQ